MLNSYAFNNGIAALDYDGIRVDERGDGDIIERVDQSQCDRNGADGLELDEAGPGNVSLDVVGSTFDGNGFFNIADLDDGLDIDEADDGGLVVRIRGYIFRARKSKRALIQNLLVLILNAAKNTGFRTLDFTLQARVMFVVCMMRRPVCSRGARTPCLDLAGWDPGPSAKCFRQEYSTG